MEVYIWHGQNRFNLYEALYPEEVQYIDDDDEQEEIELHSDEDEDMVDEPEPEPEPEGEDDEGWEPKASPKKVTRVKPKKEKRKKIQVIVTSYGVLASEHAKYEKSVRKSESSVFESTSIIPKCINTAYCRD